MRVCGPLVRAAGAAIMQHYGRAAPLDHPSAPPVTLADLAANRVIVRGLKEAFPNDAILSEESEDTVDRLLAERVWIVDPLDGTREFIAQNGEFSIQVALVVEGVPEVALVYLPALDVLYGAVRGQGAWVERSGERHVLVRGEADPGALRMVGSRSHVDPLTTRIQKSLGITQFRPSGSVGVKCALIAEGRSDLYVHPVPYLKEWDTCAPELILREAGGQMGDCLGRALRYNKLTPDLPDGVFAYAPGVPAAVRRQVTDLYTAHAAKRTFVTGAADSAPASAHSDQRVP
jgi:3'(2'), 5'-bisphosphate nucleotidase